MIFNYIFHPILQFCALIFSTLLYIVGWKKTVIAQNTKNTINLKTLNDENKSGNTFNFTQPFSRYQLLFALSYDFLSFILFRVSSKKFHPTIYISKSSQENIDEIIGHNLKQRPHILYSMHFGNFEWMAQKIKNYGIDLQVSIHPMHQTLASQFLQWLRKTPTAKNQTQNYTRDFRNQFQLIKDNLVEGKTLGWMMDQNPQKPSSIISPFLNLTTQWNPIPIYLEKKLCQEKYYCYITRESGIVFNSTYSIHFKKTKTPYPHCFQKFKDIILLHPNHYYGFTHRRFKNSHPELYTKKI